MKTFLLLLPLLSTPAIAAEYMIIDRPGSKTEIGTICLDGYKFVLALGHMKNSREFDVEIIQMYGDKATPVRCVVAGNEGLPSKRD